PLATPHRPPAPPPFPYTTLFRSVPHQRAHDAEPLHTAPQVRCMKTAAAPYTPAVPVSSPGTMRQASTAGLKARRFTSLRSGRNRDRKSTRLNSSHVAISYAVFCL